MLQNCHLVPSWMPHLERLCGQLASKDGSSGQEGRDSTHPSFRLWLSSYPSVTFPALVLRNGIKMTNEPPSGLKANMTRSQHSVKSLVDSLPMPSAQSKAIMRTVYGLCMFHAVVEGRREFGALGWNARYSFSISDL
jgi:dynein heavy chain